MSILLGSALGFFIFSLLAWGAIKWNKSRMTKEYSYRLFPNCLLTRFPVVFVHGRKSLFYFGNYWNFIPQFLIDHGYEIIDLDLPWRDDEQRTREFQRFLEVLETESLSAHFIGDITSKELIEAGAEKFPKAFLSQNIMGLRDMALPATGDEPLYFRIHRFLTKRHPDLDGRVLGITETCDLKDTGRIYLRKLVELAEMDLQHGVQHEHGFTGPESATTASRQPEPQL